jgi:glycosyltransferase involved in cell wall biosynthesis
VRVLWLAHRDPENPRAGGAERTIHEVGRRLASRGHEVVLVTAGWRGSRPRTVLDGIEVRRYPGNLGVHLALPPALMREEFDAAICDLGHAVPWPSAPLLMRGRCAVFFRHLHARTLWGQVNPVLAATLSTAERAYPLIYRDEPFVTESRSSRDDLIRLGVDPGRIVLIPPGVDHDLFRPGPKTPFPSIVYFGGMRRYKRPRDALLAFALVRREIPEARLYVVGEGPELPGLWELAEGLGIGGSVEFTGRLEYGELAGLVSSAWLNVHTSVAEGWGYSITEAAAAGTPTVAYDVPGVSDAVEEGRNGIRVRDGDVRALAEAALRILRRSPEEWWRSSREVAAKYSWDRTAGMWEGVLRHIHGRQRHRHQLEAKRYGFHIDFSG